MRVTVAALVSLAAIATRLAAATDFAHEGITEDQKQQRYNAEFQNGDRHNGKHEKVSATLIRPSVTTAPFNSMITMVREPAANKPPTALPAHTSNPPRKDLNSLVMPKLTIPVIPHATNLPNGIREAAQGPSPLQLPNIAGGLLDNFREVQRPPPPKLPGGPPGFPGGPGKPGPFPGGPPNLGPPPGKHPGNPFEPGRPSNPPPSPFNNAHVKCTTQEVSCSFLREAAYQMQNDDDHCLKIATTFDQEGKIKFDPLVQDADNVIYGITMDGLTASAWCNDIGWALRKIYSNCRRGKQCFGGDSLAARNSAFMVTVGPRDKGPRINIKVRKRFPAMMGLSIELPEFEPPAVERPDW